MMRYKWYSGPRLLRLAPGFLKYLGWGLGVTDRVIRGRVVHLHVLTSLIVTKGDNKLIT